MRQPRPVPATAPAASPLLQRVHWMALTTIAYAGLYAWSNHLTSLRTDIGEGVFAWERTIPFVAWSIVPYLSICAFFVLSFFIDADRHRLRRHVIQLFAVLLVSLLCYALLPLRFTFERPPTQGLVGLMFDLLAACDMPYNRAPSLHIGVLTVLWARFAPAVAGWRAVALHTWFALIAVSVLTTYQHHVVDVPAGAALGVLAIAGTMRLMKGPSSRGSR